MRSRLRAVLLTAILSAALTVPAGALPRGLTADLPLDAAALDAIVNGEPDGAVSSDTMSFVANVPYRNAEGEAKAGGTDVEFATLLVDGEPRDFAFAGTLGNGMQIIDITDPEDAQHVGVYDCKISQGDVQVFTREDHPGRTFVAYTMDTGYNANTSSACYREAEDLGLFTGAVHGTFIADVTDPYNPKTVSFVHVPKGSHNQTVHPSGLWMYNSNSELITNARAAAIEVIDIRDLSAPVIASTLPIVPLPGLGTDSHDITFNADGTRAYSAALSHTLIINTEDPEKPSVVGRIIDPMINVEHQSNPVTIDDPVLGAREFLIVEDEVAGAAGSSVCPTGGVHVYDITGPLEQAPVKVGYWNIDDIRPVTSPEPYFGQSCTAHVFQLHEEAGLMTIAFYNGGVRVVDISGLVGVALGANGAVGMREVGFWRVPSSDSWSFKTNDIGDGTEFYAYSNDIARGMDIVRYDAEGTAATRGTGQDRWYSAAELAAGALGAPRALLDPGYRPVCLLPR
jgi:hypothetical protein